jgi:hypothetical protein
VATTASAPNKHCRKRATVESEGAASDNFGFVRQLALDFSLLAALITLWSLPCAWNATVSTQSKGP